MKNKENISIALWTHQHQNNKAAWMVCWLAKRANKQQRKIGHQRCRHQQIRRAAMVAASMAALAAISMASGGSMADNG